MNIMAPRPKDFVFGKDFFFRFFHKIIIQEKRPRNVTRVKGAQWAPNVPHSIGARTELILPSHDAVTSMPGFVESSLVFQRRARASVMRLP